MWVLVILLIVACAALACLLYFNVERRAKLIEAYGDVKARLDFMTEDLANKRQPIADTEACQKPVSEESLRTALRFNGFSPEMPDTHQPGIIHFTIGETMFRINAGNLPYISVEAGYALDEPDENIALLKQSAEEVTAKMYVAKAYVIGNKEAVIFSAEILCDSYSHIRNNLKHYLGMLSEAHKRFYEAYSVLKEQRAEEQKAVFSGQSFVPEQQGRDKVLS